MTEQLDLSAFESLLQEVGADDGFSLSQLWRQWRTGEVALDGETLSLLRSAGLKLLGGQVAVGARLLARLLLLSLLLILLRLLSREFGGTVARLGSAVIYLLLLSVALLALQPALHDAQQAVNTMADVMNATLPLLLTLTAAVGAVGTVGMMSPLLLAGSSLLLTLLRTIVFPLLYLAAVLLLVSQVNPRFQLQALASLFKDAALGGLTILATVFLTVLGFCGVARAGADGVAFKAAKAAGGAFIPVVGRSLADALDSILGTALVLKNTIGVLGVLAVLAVCAAPALQLLLQSVVFRLAGALAQPLGGDELAACLSSAGDRRSDLLFHAGADRGAGRFDDDDEVIR